MLIDVRSDEVIIQQFARLNLEPGDQVASVTWFREYAVVVTQRGVLYRIFVSGGAT